MGGGGALGMAIIVLIDSGSSKRSYGSDTMLAVRERNPILAYGKEST